MSDVVVDISMSLDGFVTGPDDFQGQGLGRGGEPIHDWVMGGPWTYHSEHVVGGATGVDKEVLDEAMRGGAAVIGRRMYDVTDGWGESDPFGIPIFVVTSRPHPTRTSGRTTYHFVTDGVESAVEQARQAAGGRLVAIGGGARVIQQAIAAQLPDELRLHISPVLVGSGKRLFEHLGPVLPQLEQIGVKVSPNATHARYRLAWK